MGLCDDLDRLAKTFGEITVETVNTERTIELFTDNVMDFDGDLEKEKNHILDVYGNTSIELNWKIYNDPAYHGARSGKKFNL